MKTLLTLIHLCLLINFAAAEDTRAQIPDEVTQFIKRRNSCDHFRGEMPGDRSDRAKEVHKELKHYCTGSDHELFRLRMKYSSDTSALQLLSAYEDCIESNCEKLRENKH